MVKKSIFCLFLAICLVFPLSFDAYAKDDSWVTASSAVLYCPDNGEYLYEKNADTFMLIASLTKIMTGVIVLENCALDEIVCVDKCAVGTEGSSAYLCENEYLTVEGLLYALLLESANDAAIALAVHTSGNISEFVSLMNAKAKVLGMDNTHFENPHGLDCDGHGSTARDLAVLCEYALKNSEFERITSTKTVHIDDCDKTKSHYFLNHNRMLSIYDGVVGVKTGYTKASGRCLVTSAKRDGVTLIAVTLNAPNDWNDHRIMLDYGFTAMKCLVLPESEIEFNLNVVSGTNPSVKVSASPSSFVTDSYVTPDSVKTYLPEFIFAPVGKGDTVGSVVYEYEGNIVAVIPIKAEDESAQIKYRAGFFELMCRFFG